MKKMLNNSVKGTIELNDQDKARYDGEIYKSLIFTPSNHVDDNKYHSVSTFALTPERKSSINGCKDYFMGKWNVNGDFHFYKTQSDVLLTTTVGLVRSNHPVIYTAIRSNNTRFDLYVPGFGVYNFELPWTKDDKGNVNVNVNCPWLRIRLTGLQDGKLLETDYDQNLPPVTKYYHNVISSLAAGYRIVIDVTFRKIKGVLNTEIHDLAKATYDLLTDDNLDTQRYLEEQKEINKEYREIKSQKSTAQAQLDNAEINKKELPVSNTVVIINGGDPIDPMQVPSGTYILVDDNGKKLYGTALYSVNAQRDRAALRLRGDVVRMISVK